MSAEPETCPMCLVEAWVDDDHCTDCLARRCRECRKIIHANPKPLCEYCRDCIAVIRADIELDRRKDEGR